MENDKPLETKQEAVSTVYKGSELVAIVKRDEFTKKHLVYLVKDACTEDITNLINNK